MANKKTSNRISLLLWTIIPLILTGTTVWFSRSLAIETIEQNSTKVDTKQIYTPVQNATDFESVNLGNNGAITLWFDDAWGTQYSEAFPLITKYGMRGALAVPTRLIDEPNYMTWDQVRFMAESGWEIVSHSQHHNCKVHELSFDVLNEEIEGSKKDLMAKGIATNIYVPPCGVTNHISDSLVLYHYDFQRLVERGYNTVPVENPYKITVQQMDQETTKEIVQSWVDTAEQQDSWLILMFHQIDYEGRTYSASPELLRDTLEIITKSNLVIVTPSEILNSNNQ